MSNDIKKNEIIEANRIGEYGLKSSKNHFAAANCGFNFRLIIKILSAILVTLAGFRLYHN